MIKRIHGTIIKYDLFEYSVKNGIVALKLYEGWSNYLLNQGNDTQKMYRGKWPGVWGKDGTSENYRILNWKNT